MVIVLCGDGPLSVTGWLSFCDGQLVMSVPICGDGPLAVTSCRFVMGSWWWVCYVVDGRLAVIGCHFVMDSWSCLWNLFYQSQNDCQSQQDDHHHKAQLSITKCQPINTEHIDKILQVSLIHDQLAITKWQLSTARGPSTQSHQLSITTWQPITARDQTHRQDHTQNCARSSKCTRINIAPTLPCSMQK